MSLHSSFIQGSQKNAGFTLLELLIVIIILGILSALAWPTYLSQAGKARQAGAEMLIGKVNRSQQVYRIIHGTFATNYADLEDFNTLPNPDGYTFAPNMTATNNEGIVEAESNDLVSQPHLCGIANLSTTQIEEDTTFNDGNCP
ncbi:prepilin-type N-terminal cleavage/methylation domain-containing protein [Halothece sp. PCC 7418]|uniref:prepilin-type N-terminal cleavage/methylation domain-containing protein n=1 Tax=Halothece sp. (strain PCC 7418) TaxID=65093 RepID=UPI0009FCB350|nr:prepilin-type N-terminal cleavage/methylation domain-containing protein [Halothece sp. PCC 7418]